MARDYGETKDEQRIYKLEYKLAEEIASGCGANGPMTMNLDDIHRYTRGWMGDCRPLAEKVLEVLMERAEVRQP